MKKLTAIILTVLFAVSLAVAAPCGDKEAKKACKNKECCEMKANYHGKKNGAKNLDSKGKKSCDLKKSDAKASADIKK